MAGTSPAPRFGSARSSLKSVHWTDLPALRAERSSPLKAAGMRSLGEGQKVSFDILPDARGAKAGNLALA